MPQITNPQAISFSNSRIRPFADELYALYLDAKAIQAEYASKGLNSVFVPTSDQVMDGADVDGRTIIHSQDVNAIMNLINSLINLFETGDVSGKGQGNNNILMNIAKVQVNGGNRARFR